MAENISPEAFDKLHKYYLAHPEEFPKDVFDVSLWKTQVDILKSTFENKYTAIKTCNAIGKAMSLDTPLLTTDGWKNFETVEVGDRVFSPMGMPIKVTHTHPIRERETYRVTFDNRTSLTVDGDHMWDVLPLLKRGALKGRVAGSSDWRMHWEDAATMKTSDMAQNVKARGINNYLIPTTSPIEMPSANLPLDPYVFGVWLGDGHSNATTITKPDQFIRDKFIELGYEVKPHTNSMSFAFMPRGEGEPMLRHMNVQRNKHIPKKYMLASYEQRLALMRGLMDTDGYCSKANGVIELCFTNQRLSEDAAALASTFGWKVAVTESDAKLNGRFISRRWRIHFKADVNPFSLPRKADLWRPPIIQKSKSTGHLIIKIEKVDTVPTRCITVETLDGLFLAGHSLIPTHNSFVAANVVVTYLMLYPGSLVVTTAPTWRQVTDVLWREVRTLVKKSKYKLTDKEVNQAGLSLDTDWYAVGLSTSRPENFFGYHANHILVVVDEAGGVDEDVFRGVAAITPNLNARVLLIGNPTNPSGTFFDAFVKKELGYNCFTVSAFDTPNFTQAGIKTLEQLLALFTPPAGVEQKDWNKYVNKKLSAFYSKNKKGESIYESLISPEVVYARYYEWGTDDPRWSSLIMGNFPSQASGALIPTDLLRIAMRYYEIDKDTGKTYGDLMGWNVTAGLPRVGQDMARFGGDRNVNTHRAGGIVKKQMTWNKIDLMTSADRILDFIDPTDPLLRVNIDDTGNGGGTTDRIHQIDTEKRMRGEVGHVFRLAPYNMSSKERMADKMRFHDVNSELWFNLRNWFVAKAIAFEQFDQELFDELVDRRWWLNKSGKIQVESKDEFRDRVSGRRSPDKADSLVLAFAGEKPTGEYHDVKTKQDDYYDRRKEEARPVTAGLRDTRY